MDLNTVFMHLPYRLSDEIKRITESGSFSPEEIRIRSNRRASLTYDNKNIMLDTVIKSEEMHSIVLSLCGQSIYAYKDSISRGYISINDGFRIGICGSASCENGKINAVYNVTSLVIRIPHQSEFCGDFLCEHLKSKRYKSSCLIFSPSGVGKTTVLRSVAFKISSGSTPLRVCVVDSREELGAFLSGSGLCIDVLKGYPKEKGIEIAARTLNAQLIICDEIFGEAEALALSGAVNCGIPILCSAHAGTVHELISRPGIDLLHKMKVFDDYVRISRTEKRFVFDYEITPMEALNVKPYSN